MQCEEGDDQAIAECNYLVQIVGIASLGQQSEAQVHQLIGRSDMRLASYRSGFPTQHRDVTVEHARIEGAIHRRRSGDQFV